MLVRYRLDLVGVHPHAAAVRAGLDLDPMVRLRREVVAVLRALHVVGPPLRFQGGGLRLEALLPEQLGVLLDEVFALVAAGFLAGHRLGTLSVEARGRQAARDVKNPRPSGTLSSGSAVRSGWGMIPTTVPPALQMPAMWCAEPLGFGCSGDGSVDGT